MSAALTAAPARFSLGRARGLAVAVLVFIVLFGLVNLISTSSFGYFDFAYMSAGGATLALAAVGQTLVILTGGFDLSAGAAIGLVNVMLASHLQASLPSEIGWSIAALATGGAVGLFNGVFVALLRLQPIVVTLSTMFIAQGLTLLVLDKPGGVIPPEFSAFFTGSAIPGLLPAPVVELALVVGLWLLIKHTRFGTALYAVGSDPDACAYAGIRVVATRLRAYTLAGLAYGAAGIMVTAQTATGDPLVGSPLLLQIFAAVVIGGTMLGGGRGGCTGSIVGAYSLMLVVNILLVLNVSAYYSTVVEGLVLVLAALGGTSGGWARWRLPARASTAVVSRRPLVTLVSAAAVLAPAAGYLRRHAETIRYAVPAYVCFAVVLVATAVTFGGLQGSYWNSLIVLASFLAVLALGQGAVILTGGLDLSVPWTIGLCGVLLGTLVRGSDELALIMVPAVLAVGALVGLFNGFGIVTFGLPPIVVTLAANGILQGIALLVSGGTPDGFASPSLRWLMTGHLGPVTPVVWFIAGFVAFGTLLLGGTPFGRRVYAIGNSPRVARLSGVNVGRVTILVYVLSGLCAALVGILLDGFSGQASLGMGDDYLLPSIAVVVVGGTLITGGRGHYLGMVGGVLLLTALQTLLAGTNLPPALRDIIYGLVVLASVVALRERSAA